MTSTIYDIFDTPEVNEDTFENGKWVPISADSSVKIRHAGSPHTQKLRRKIDEPYAQRIAAGIELTEEENLDVYFRTMSESIIADWKGPAFVDEKGKPMKCTPSKVLSILKDPKMAKFSSFVLGIAKSEEEFLANLDDSSEKN